MKLLLVSALVFVLAQTSFALSLQQEWGSFRATHKKQYLTATEEVSLGPTMFLVYTDDYGIPIHHIILQMFYYLLGLQNGCLPSQLGHH